MKYEYLEMLYKILTCVYKDIIELLIKDFEIKKFIYSINVKSAEIELINTVFNHFKEY